MLGGGSSGLAAPGVGSGRGGGGAMVGRGVYAGDSDVAVDGSGGGGDMLGGGAGDDVLAGGALACFTSGAVPRCGHTTKATNESTHTNAAITSGCRKTDRMNGNPGNWRQISTSA